MLAQLREESWREGFTADEEGVKGSEAVEGGRVEEEHFEEGRSGLENGGMMAQSLC
jgi:hypothetical protein